MKVKRNTLMFAGTFIWIFSLAATAAASQVPAASTSAATRRTADGKPDLNGIWQALNSAAWDIQDQVGQLVLQTTTGHGHGRKAGNDSPSPHPASSTGKSLSIAPPAWVPCSMARRRVSPLSGDGSDPGNRSPPTTQMRFGLSLKPLK